MELKIMQLAPTLECNRAIVEATVTPSANAVVCRHATPRRLLCRPLNVALRNIIGQVTRKADEQLLQQRIAEE